ncbi:TPA: prophage tail fiber N-terminal domain-containing protein [Escherichia coli]
MAVQISGVLKDDAGKPIQNCTIQLKAKRNSTTVLVNTVASENPDEAGSYSMDVEHGQYSVTLLVEGFPPSHAGTITVYEGSRPGTLNDFLGAMTEDDVMPEALRRFEAMVEEAARNAEAASQSAAAAKKSETAAANSQKAAKTSETNAKSSQTVAKTSETNAKASETAAKNSQDAAAESESAAAGSASEAAISATASANSQKAAKTSENNAKASETAAANSAKASAASQTAAKASEDAAREYASQAAEPYKQVLQPLPDVWIPFNDSLDMITGFSPSYKKIVIGDDEITMPGDKVVKFKRASKATYINKSGVLTEAAIDEPRFEKNGLLIEGTTTNNFINSNSPANWNRNTNRLSVSENSIDEFGFTQATFTYKESSDTGPVTLISTGTSRVIPVVGGEYVTISIRVKGAGCRARHRISKLNDDGNGNTFIADAMLDLDTAKLVSDVLSSRVDYDPASGWYFFQSTFKATEDMSVYARTEMLAKSGGELVAGNYIKVATAQVEKCSHATSLIITNDVPATRASDLVNIPVKNNMYDAPITILAEVHRNWEWELPPNAAPRIMDFSGVPTGQAVIFGCRGGTAANTGSPYIDVGADAGRVNSYLVTKERKFVAGFRITKDYGVHIVLNGDIPPSVPKKTAWRYVTKNTSIRFGGQTSTGERHLFGHIRNFRNWHKELTETQMGEKIS